MNKMNKDRLSSIELLQLMEFLNSIENVITLKDINQLSIKDIEKCLRKERFKKFDILGIDKTPAPLLSNKSEDKKDEEEYSFECGGLNSSGAQSIECYNCIFNSGSECNLNSVFWKFPTYILVGRIQKKRLWLLKIIRKLKRSQYDE